MIQTCIVIALAAGCAATTIARSKVFAWLRAWPEAHSQLVNLYAHESFLREHRMWHSRSWMMLSLLLRCPYCIVHWATFVLVAVYQPALVHSGSQILDIVVTAFATVAAASGVAAVLCRVFTFEEQP